MTYKEKLLDPRWQNKRQEILLRDNYTCQFCNSNIKTLQVHHKYYKKAEPWDYENDALITLCIDCHSLETDFYTHEIKILDNNNQKINIYTNDSITIISDSNILDISIEDWRKINFKIERRLNNK